MSLRTRAGQLISFFFRSVFWSITIVLALYTLLAYWLLYTLSIEHWLAGMIMISIPVVWLMNLIVGVVWGFTRPWRTWLPAIVVLLGVLLFGRRTFSWHSPEPSVASSVTLFSYNVQSFFVNNQPDRTKLIPEVKDAIDYVVNYDAPIKCLQEATNVKPIPAYNLYQRMQEAGYKYSIVLNPAELDKEYGNPAMAIFSKYPIIHSDREAFGTNNGILWANIKIGNDTIRVINVHLHSMGIRVGKVLKQQEMTGVKHETHGVLSALRTGFIERQWQVRHVERHIRESEFPVLVAGDFNDTPYSVVYERMRRVLPSSFEDAGHSFGFSYNRLPGYIRIDNQFHDPRIPALKLETINTVRYSDHYPLAGTYALGAGRNK